MQLRSVKETAERFNISERRVQKLCEAGRIDGAQMISNVWLIPDNASKPIDKRCSVEMNNMVSLSELCKELSISVATGRNWVKLGKLIPSEEIKRTPYFSYDYLIKVKSEIVNGDNSALKSRRNKKYVTGNNIYNSYVTEKSLNLSLIQNILNSIEQNNIEISDDFMVAIIADCAVQMIISRTVASCTKVGLMEYLDGSYSDNQYIYLVDDLLSDKNSTLSIIERYPQFFSYSYAYEENEDVLGLLYISLKSISKRKATGSYYTPTKVVQKMCEKIFTMNSAYDKTVLDPCCGTGNFIIQLPKEIEYENVYGNDIDAVSVKIARINYALKYLISNSEIIYKHITIKDYLSFTDELKFDYIIGNPPWGYVYSDDEKSFLINKYVSAEGASIESYDIFIEQALSNLKNNGILSFVLPEAVLNVKSHTKIRELMLASNSFQYVDFLGNAFDKVQCPCIILQMLHTNEKFCSKGMVVRDNKREFVISDDRKIDSKCFSFGMTDDEYRIINKIENVSNKKTLLGNAVFALGIVTGNNKEYIAYEKRSDNEMVLKGSDICKFRTKESDNYIVFKPDSFQQIAPTEYYRAKEKLLYRFICNQLVFAYDNKQTLSLNSCNIVIPQIQGLNIKYIMAILNSRIAQFYFKKQFNSVKVLRSHIEQIPIPMISKEAQEEIISIVDNLLEASDNGIVMELYNKLDLVLVDLYGFSNDEYNIICSSMEGENLFLF